MVKTKARAGKVWEYVDSSLTADKVLKLIEPKISKPSDMREGAMSPVDLTDDELKKLQQLQCAVRPEFRELELKREGIV